MNNVMTQDERWSIKYQEVMEFIERYHRNPSRHRIEEHLMLNWVKANRKVLNAGKMKEKRVEKENGIYLKFTKDMLKKHHIRLTNDDVRRILHGFYTNPNDFSKRPLSKFRTDLAKDLGLL